MAEEVLIVLVTCPQASASNLAQGLVSDRVAACVNVVSGVESHYRWQDKVESETEAMLVVKTTRQRFEALKEAVLKRHPNELPEVIAVTVDQGHLPYLDWVVQNSH